MTCARLSSAYPEIWEAIVSCGQPFAACHARLGAQSRSAIPTAAHGHGERRTSQRRVMTRPTASPAPRNRSVSLFSRPIPVATPTASHSRRSSPASSFTSNHRMTAQASRSGIRRRIEVTSAQVAGHGGRDRCEDLRAARSSEVTRHERDQDHDERHLEGRQHTNGRRRCAEEGDRGRGKQRRQGWLIDVAKRRVLACDDEVHLVAVEAVLPGHSKQTDDEHTGATRAPAKGRAVMGPVGWRPSPRSRSSLPHSLHSVSSSCHVPTVGAGLLTNGR